MFFNTSPPSQRQLISALMMSVALVSLIITSAQAQNLPQNATIAAGQVKIDTPSPQQMTITQSSPAAIINWSSFNIGQNSTVTFNQPSAASTILNRVSGTTTSFISGQLNGNGQIFLVNPNGIAITRSGVVNVAGGFIASTLGISDTDFLNGKLNFLGNGASAQTSSDGTITIGKNGYVALLGGSISNTGLVRVPLGKVEIGAGEQITLDLTGDGFMQVAVPSTTTTGTAALIDIAGKISATGGSIDIKAASVKQAIRDAVNVEGTLNATSVSSHNGVITLDGGEGGNVTIASNANITTSHKSKTSGNAGNISVRGQNITTQDGAQFSANANQNGNGGTISLIAANQGLYSGIFQARAGAFGGNGGIIETSGAKVSFSNVKADASSLKGKSGSWLIDPLDISIDASNVSSITDALSNGTPVTISTSESQTTLIGGSSGLGDITINSAIILSSASGTLTLNADHAIIFNQPLTISSDSTILLQLNTGTTTYGGIAYAVPNLRFNNGASIIFLSPSSSNLVINNQSYTLISSANDLAVIDLTAPNQYIALVNNNIDLTNAPITNLTSSGLHLEGLGNSLQNYSSTTPLFNSLDSSSSITNLHLINFNVSNGTAALVDSNAGLIMNTSLDTASIVNISGNAGGLVANNTGYIQNVTATNINVTSSDGANSTGGLVGFNSGIIGGSKITNSIISGAMNSGGFVGENYGTITSSGVGTYATKMSITGQDNVGGFAGFNAGSITDSIAHTSINASGHVIGGFIGANSGQLSTSLSDSDFTTATQQADLLIGQNNSGSVQNNYYVGSENIGTNRSNNLNALILSGSNRTAQSSYSALDFTSVWNINDGSSAPNLRALDTPLYITLSASGKIYDGSNLTGSISNWSDPSLQSSLSALSVGFYQNGSLISSAKNVGTYNVGVNASAIDPHLLSEYNIILNADSTTAVAITPAIVTISGISAYDKTYDKTRSVTLSYTNVSFGNANSLARTDGLTVSASGTFDNGNAGTDKIVTLSNLVLGNNALGNYQLSTSGNQTSATAEITKADITVSGITAASKNYDGTTSASLNTSTAQFAGLINGDQLTISAQGGFNDANAGTTKTVTISNLTLGGLSLANYQLSSSGNQTTTTANIDKAISPLLVTPTANQFKYSGSKDPILTYTLSSSLNLSDPRAYNVSGQLGRTSGDQAGIYNYTLGTLSSTNFNLVLKETSDAFSIKNPPISYVLSQLQPAIQAIAEPLPISQLQTQQNKQTCTPLNAHNQLFDTGSIAFSGGMGCL
jgi:filamentous hemagglutinin family protein